MADYLPPVVAELTGDDSKFIATLRSAKDRATQFATEVGRLKAEISVTADDARARATVDRLKADLGRISLSMRVTVQVDRRQVTDLRAELRSAAMMRVAVSLETGARERVARELSSGRDLEVTAKVKPVLDRTALAAVRRDLRALGQPIRVAVTPELPRRASLRVQSQLDQLARDRTATIRVRTVGGGPGTPRAPQSSTSRRRLPDLPGSEAVGGLATPVNAAVSMLVNPAVLSGVGALTAGLVASGAAVGAFGLAAAHEFQGIAASSAAATKAQTAQETASRKQAEAQALAATGGKAYKSALTASASATKTAKDAQLAYKDSLAGLPKPTQDTAMALFKLKSEYASWSDSVSGSTMPVFTKGLNLAASILPKLTPLVKTAGSALSGFEGDLQKGVNGGGFDRLVKSLNTAAKTDLPDFLKAFKNIGVGVAGVISTFLPESGQMAGGLDKLTGKFANFGKNMGSSSAFAQFEAMAKKDGPEVEKAVSDIAGAVGHLSTAMGPLSGSTVKVIDLIAQGISAIPAPILAQVAEVLPYVILGTKAWAVAQAALDIVLDDNPIGLIVTALGAAVIGFKAAWSASQTFRNIVTEVFTDLAVPVLEYAKISLMVDKEIVAGFLSFVSTMISGAAKAFGWVPGLGGKLRSAAKAVEGFKNDTDGFFNSAISTVNGWQKTVEAMPQRVKLEGDESDLEKKVVAAQAQLKKNIPASQKIKLQADISNWQTQLAQAKVQLQSVPAKKEAVLSAQITQWQQQVAVAEKQLESAPASKRAVLDAEISNLTYHVSQAKSALASIQSKTVTITYKGVTEGKIAGSAYTSTTGYSYANGGIHIPGLRKAADGLMTRSAGFSSSPILWGEAGPEAYIPLSASKRPRSREIASQTVSALGGQVAWGAAGTAASGMGAFDQLGAQIPAGVARGISAGQAAAQKAAVGLAKATTAGFSTELQIASPSKKFKSLAAYVIDGLVQGLTGSTASVKAAAKRVANDLYVDFGDTHKALQKAVAKDNAQLIKLAGERDSVATKLKSAQSKLASLQSDWTKEKQQVSSDIMSGASVVMDASNNNNWLSSSQVVQNFQAQAQQAQQFAAYLKQAQANGLNSAMVQQIAAAGVSGGYATAQALASANSGQIKQLNSMQKSMQSSADSVGTATANSMYGAGIKSAQGLVKGLQSQEKAIEKEMDKIAASMKKTLEKALDIHSPSRVFAKIGTQIPAGLGVGIRSGTHHATGAVMSMSSAVVGAGAVRIPAGGGGGVVVHQHFYIKGSVVAERQLSQASEQGMLRAGARRSQTYAPYKR